MPVESAVVEILDEAVMVVVDKKAIKRSEGMVKP